MSKKLRGKYLIKKSILQNGEQVLTLTGVFHPSNFSVDEISDGDEMWVSDIVIEEGGIKFTEPDNHVSPEDFLSGQNHSPKSWKNKNNL